MHRLLKAWKPLRVVSSPWLRCVATIAPYAKAADAKVKLGGCADGAPARPQPQKDRCRRGAPCSTSSAPWCCARTGPALPTVLDQLAGYMSPRLKGLLPVADPYLAPGEMIVCHVAHGSKSRIVSVEQFKPFDD